MQRMASLSKSPVARAVAVFALMAGVGVAVPANADDVQAPPMRLMLAAADTAPMTASAQTAEPSAAVSLADKHVEARIKDLHARFGITADQEDAWGKVAQAMRDNANSMASLTQTRVAAMKSMSAVDDLKSYAEIAQAHADGLQKFTPVFTALYGTMSDQQKQNADSIFRAHGVKAMKHMMAKG